MKIIMKEEQLSSINDLVNFIQGSQKIVYAILANKKDKYLWVQSILIKFEYYTLNKSDKGIVQRYIQKITDYSRQQLSRLINQHKKSGYVGNNVDNGRRFELRYTKDDVQALVAIDLQR